jgi:organic hydroperoxide reductase OsmC/OhrA
MSKEHFYSLTITWTGNHGDGTTSYRSYERSHIISAENKADILASSDQEFRGDKTKYNPEELLVASLSSCHMLWFLHLCADNGVVVMDYFDNPVGTMVETEDGGGQFKEVILRPTVIVEEESMLEKLDELHKKSRELCFIANSVNFPVVHKPTGTIL